MPKTVNLTVCKWKIMYQTPKYRYLSGFVSISFPLLAMLTARALEMKSTTIVHTSDPNRHQPQLSTDNEVVCWSFLYFLFYFFEPLQITFVLSRLHMYASPCLALPRLINMCLRPETEGEVMVMTPQLYFLSCSAQFRSYWVLY